MADERNNTKQTVEKKEHESILKRLTKRFSTVTIVLFILMGILAGRLIWIVVIDGDKYTMAALTQSTGSSTTLEAKRGDILDRNGVQLVTSAMVYNLILDPKVILTDEETYLEPTVTLIEKYFNIPKDELIQKVHDNPDRQYVVLKKELTYSEVEEFQKEADEDANVRGVWLEDKYKRTYIYDDLAASVLGFTKDGVGLYGLEYYYDEELSGSDGLKYSIVSSDNSIEVKTVDAIDGYTLVSTIDYNIQSIVKKYIAETKEQTQAESVAVIIQNPNTGEIYAMADSEEFNANNPWDMSAYYTEEELKAMTDQQTSDVLTTRWKNFCITEAFEPGSTFKPFTLSAALTNGTTTMSDLFYCEGSKMVYEEEIHCHEREGHGDLDTKGAMAHSCNVALMDMADALGATEFCKMQSRFGFGHSTGIDLPNEMSCHGLIYTIDNIGPVDLATNAFGQNFETTMIQMSTAFCSLVNGGNYYKPYVIKSIATSDGELIETHDRTLISTTVSSEMAKKVKECMRAVVTEGTGKYAAVTGYKIAGKTGTAEIYEAKQRSDDEDDEENEGYSKAEDVYVISFIGFAPYDNPEVVCYVVLDKPNTGEDSSVASILFSKIMTEVLPYLNITPDGESTDVAQWERIYDDYSDEDYSDEQTDGTEEATEEATEEYTEEYTEEATDETYYDDGDSEEEY